MTVTLTASIAAVQPPPATALPIPQPPHAEFLGLRFCLLPQSEAIRLVLEHDGAPYRYVVTPNSSHVVAAHKEPAQLLPIYRRAWLSLCDSRIIRALAKLERRALPLVTGSDLVAALFATLNNRDCAVAPPRLLIVGPPRSAEPALRAAYPKVTFEMLPAPARLADNAELRLAVARACLARRWDIALLCVGSPAQELIAQQLGELGCRSGVALCVGASVDFLTGARLRAPLWLQKLNLEWAYRLVQEPGRLWRRYLVDSPKILRVLMTTRRSRSH